MPTREEPPMHPQQAANERELAERQRLADAGKLPEPPAPHPQQAIADALGVSTAQLDRDAVAEYLAGHAKKAEAAQAKVTGGEDKA